MPRVQPSRARQRVAKAVKIHKPTWQAEMAYVAIVRPPTAAHLRSGGTKGNTAAMAAQPTSPMMSRSRIVFDTPAAQHSLPARKLTVGHDGVAYSQLLIGRAPQ